MKPQDAANVTMGIGMIFLVRGAYGLLNGSGIDPVQSVIGLLGLLGGGIWRLRM
jgi:hypothetical protein